MTISTRLRVPYALDVEAQAFVCVRALGATRPEIAEALDVSEHAIRIAERDALKWACAALILDIWASGTSVAEVLASFESDRDGVWDAWGRV